MLWSNTCHKKVPCSLSWWNKRKKVWTEVKMQLSYLFKTVYNSKTEICYRFRRFVLGVQMSLNKCMLYKSYLSYTYLSFSNIFCCHWSSILHLISFILIWYLNLFCRGFLPAAKSSTRHSSLCLFLLIDMFYCRHYYI